MKGVRKEWWRLRLKSKTKNMSLIVDEIIFKIVYVFEPIVLVSTLCFFYISCGCHL
ncbi:hypothetical protein ABFX02_08G196700 [Erythranthe guttata]